MVQPGYRFLCNTQMQTDGRHRSPFSSDSVNSSTSAHSVYYMRNLFLFLGSFYGIGVTDGAHDFVLNRVVMHHFSLYGFDASASGGAVCYNGTFNDCIAHTGRDLAQNVDGFALGHGTQHDFVFNRCIVYNIYDGFDISSKNTTLNRCLAYDCWNGGYKLWQDEIKKCLRRRKKFNFFYILIVGAIFTVVRAHVIRKYARNNLDKFRTKLCNRKLV